MASKLQLLRPLADPATAAPFLAAYDALVADVVAPHVAALVAAADGDLRCDCLHYAAFPTLRVQTPSSSRATIRPHFDGMYGLQPGSLNFWLPLTDVRGASALWLESDAKARGGASRDGCGSTAPTEAADGAGVAEAAAAKAAHTYTYHPLTRASLFDGRSTIHFTIPNRSPRTRVSLDFRVVPGPLFDAQSRLARLGYYSTCERGGSSQGDSRGGGRGGGRGFRKAASGRLSKLHGIPHEGRPVAE